VGRWRPRAREERRGEERVRQLEREREGRDAF
jgi:hypothetical protein